MKRDNQKQNSDKLDLDQYLLIPIFLILLIFATSEARATEATAIQTSEAKVEDVAPDAAKKFYLSVTLEHDSNLSSRSNPDRDESTSLIFEPKYKFSEKSSLAGRVDIIQDYDSEGRTKVSNSVLVFTPTKIDLSSEVTLEPEISTTLPTDAKMRDDESYQGTISLRPTFKYSPSAIKNLVIMNRIYFNRSFHQYEVKSDYSANVEHSIRNRLMFTYSLSEKLGIDVGGDYVRSWTYEGYSREAFYLVQAIGYEFLKDWAVTAMHENEGSTRGPNNNGENVSIVNDKFSYVSLGITHVF